MRSKNKPPQNYCYYCAQKLVVTYNLNWYLVLPAKGNGKVLEYSCKPCIEGTEPPNSKEKVY